MNLPDHSGRLAALGFAQELGRQFRAQLDEARALRLTFYKRIAALGSAYVVAPALPRREWITRLAAYGAEILQSRAEPRALALERFEEHLIPGWQHLRWRLDGATTHWRASLSQAGRRALEVLEVEPDLTSALDDTRGETTYSRLVANLMCADHFPELAPRLREALVRLVWERRKIDDDLPDVTKATSLAEHSVVESGRLDVLIEAATLIMVVEMKVDMPATLKQLVRYKTWLDSLDRSAEKRGVLVLLAPKDKWCDGAEHTAVLLDYEDLLRAWLPVVSESRSTERSLAAAVTKSIALHLCGLAGPGGFDRWGLSRRRRTLAFVQELSI